MSRDPILVVIFLRGGADGLALVTPASDPDFIAARPEALRVLRQGDAAGRLIRQDIADTEFRFHQAAAALADLYDAGDLSLIHAAGFPEATRSHFDAEARIERGLFAASIPPGDQPGWIGRWLQAAAPGGPMPALAVGAMRPGSLLGAVAAVAETLADLVIAPGYWLSDAGLVGGLLRANTGVGTDHGRGNVMMVLGPQAKAGRMVGRWPGLANDALEEGADLAVVTDYRDVLGELLTGHMQLGDTGAVFPGHEAKPTGLWG